MSWAEQMMARLADFVDETAVKHSTPTRDYNERVGRRDTRRQIRSEIEMGEHQPSTRTERGWPEHAKRKGWME